jgi:hypothetical protein
MGPISWSVCLWKDFTAFFVDVPDVVKDNIVIDAVYEGQSSNEVLYVFAMYKPLCKSISI